MKYFSQHSISTFCTAAIGALLLFMAGWTLPVEEVSGTVDKVGSDYVVLNSMRFTVNGDTEFEGFRGLSDVRAGDEAEVEYRSQNGGHVALGIEKGAEMTGTVEEVGSDYVVINGSRFAISSGTEFEEGYGRLSDVQSRDRAEVEYETKGDGTKVALGLEKGGDDGDDENDDDEDDS